MSNIDKITSRVNTYLPKFILESNIFRDIFKSIIYESDYLDDYIKSITNELNILTATKSIDKWEALSGISNLNLNINERRDSVIKKFSAQVHANYYNFLEMLKTYDDTTVLKEIIGEYRIEIKTKKHISYDDFLNYLNVINNYKPAHIAMDLESRREVNISIYTGIGINRIKNLKVNISPHVEDLIESSFFVGVGVKRCKKIKVQINPINYKAVLGRFVCGAMKVGEINDNT